MIWGVHLWSAWEHSHGRELAGSEPTGVLKNISGACIQCTAAYHWVSLIVWWTLVIFTASWPGCGFDYNAVWKVRQFSSFFLYIKIYPFLKPVLYLARLRSDFSNLWVGVRVDLGPQVVSLAIWIIWIVSSWLSSQLRRLTLNRVPSRKPDSETSTSQTAEGSW